VAQPGVTRALSDAVSFTESFDTDHGFTHHLTM
jgi:hypothetical protein